MITFRLNIDPVAKGRPRFYNGRAITPPETRAFEKSVKLAASVYRPKAPYKGRVRFTATFYLRAPQRRVREHPTCKPDWDNLGKAVSDALNGVFWEDDGQITDARVIKVYDWATRKTGIEVTVEEINP